ncbi:MAG: hypothetical protein MUF78_11930, partial [Candidatus Edwardsbacteria bacterium]|nr:hypothetical protein [Candidatus Edwardsbacteria bacterium]
MQSAKTGLGLMYRSLNAVGSYSGATYYGTVGGRDSYSDLWSFQSVGYAPNDRMAVLATGVAHGESWQVPEPGPLAEGLDKTLACPGDAFVSGKYRLALGERVDVALEPMVSVPMDRAKYQDYPSQSGKLDVGGKVLCDVRLGPATVLVNAGYLTRGDERAMLPVGLGVEYGFNDKITAFIEGSGELRLGAQRDSLADSQVTQAGRFDRTELRVTPGVRYAPFRHGAVVLAADLTLTKTGPPWQVILGLDIPAAAGRFLSTAMLGAIAG